MEKSVVESVASLQLKVTGELQNGTTESGDHSTTRAKQSDTEESAPKHFLFMNLPAEILNLIYEAVVHSNDGILRYYQWHQDGGIALTQVNRKIRREFRAFYLSSQQKVVVPMTLLGKYLEAFPLRDRALSKKISTTLRTLKSKRGLAVAPSTDILPFLTHDWAQENLCIVEHNDCDPLPPPCPLAAMWELAFVNTQWKDYLDDGVLIGLELSGCSMDAPTCKPVLKFIMGGLLPINRTYYFHYREHSLWDDMHDAFERVETVFERSYEIRRRRAV